MSTRIEVAVDSQDAIRNNVVAGTYVLDVDVAGWTEREREFLAESEANVARHKVSDPHFYEYHLPVPTAEALHEDVRNRIAEADRKAAEAKAEAAKWFAAGGKEETRAVCIVRNYNGEGEFHASRGLCSSPSGVRERGAEAQYTYRRLDNPPLDAREECERLLATEEGKAKLAAAKAEEARAFEAAKKQAFEEFARLKEKWEREDAARYERQAAEEAAKAAAAKKLLDQRMAWAKQHGSERLKKCIAEGIEHDAIYRDERLAIERPGWRWEREVPGGDDEPRNPPLKALKMLEKARETDPEAKLVYWTVDACDDEHDEDEDDECPGYHEGWRGYAVLADYMDTQIVFGGPPPADE